MTTSAVHRRATSILADTACIALLVIRLPGTLLALVLKADICWTDVAFVPTIQGQYLIKDAILFTAAMVIGGNLRRDQEAPDTVP